MPAPTVLPGRAFQQVDLRSRLLFHWRASDQSLVTVGGLSTGVFTRASAGGEVAETNSRLVGPAADGLERWEYVDTDADAVRDASALRLEAARTNSWAHSEDLSNAAWTKSQATIDTNSTITAAPDGRFTADLIVPSTVNGEHYILRSAASTVDDAIQILTIFGRAQTNKWIRFLWSDKAGAATNAYINLDTGELGTENMATDPTFVEFADSWFRVTFRVPNSTGAAGPFVQVNLASTDGTVAFSGGGAGGLYLWGCDLEKDTTFATSYIPTVGSAVTRAAEFLYFPYTAKPQAMTLYCKVPEWKGGVVSGALAHIGAANAATDPRSVLSITAAGALQATYDDGTTAAATGTVGAPSDGDLVEAIVTLTVAGVIDMAVSLNGGALTHVASGAGGPLPPAWAAQRLYVNSAGSNTPIHGSYQTMKIAPGVRSMQYMRAAF